MVVGEGGAYERQFTVSSTCFFSGTRLAVYLPVHHNSHSKVPSGWWVCELHWTVGTGDPTNNRHQVSFEFFALEKKSARGDLMFANERWLFTRDPNYSTLNEKEIVFFSAYLITYERYGFAYERFQRVTFWLGKLSLVIMFMSSLSWGRQMGLLYLYRDVIPFYILIIPFAVLQNHVLYWSNGSMVWQ